MAGSSVYEWVRLADGERNVRYMVDPLGETCSCMTFLKHAVCKHLVVQAARDGFQPVTFSLIRVFANRSLKGRRNSKGPAALALPALQRQ